MGNGHLRGCELSVVETGLMLGSEHGGPLRGPGLTSVSDNGTSWFLEAFPRAWAEHPT